MNKDWLSSQKVEESQSVISIASLSSKASRMSKSIVYLAVALIIVAIISATIVVAKMVNNDEQNKKLEEIQSQIYEKAKQLERE